jgi:cysteine synthase B
MTQSIGSSIVTYENPQIFVPPASAGLDSHVGSTPLLPLKNIAGGLSPNVQVFAKAEWFNPGGSIKDRPALNIIRTAIDRGYLSSEKRLLDATSGNMGIAYATFGAAMSVPVTLTIPANASKERLSILHSLGAELILTDPLEGTDGAILKAQELVEKNPDLYFHANQYDNPANWQAHFLTTGPEIVQQTGGCITHFVAGMGTSGTMTGVGRYLHQYNADIRLAAVQPDSPFHGLEGLKHMQTAIQPAIFDPSVPDRTLEIRTEDAYKMVRRLAREEGLFVGISSGANVLAALRLGEELDEGVIVTVFPDSGYKYLSDEALWDE